MFAFCLQKIRKHNKNDTNNTININDKILNIRSGCLLIYEYTYLIECTKNENHQTIPGGRIKLLESSKEQ